MKSLRMKMQKPHYTHKPVHGNQNDKKCSFFFNEEQARSIVLSTLFCGHITQLTVGEKII